jgi:hypothetical protein
MNLAFLSKRVGKILADVGCPMTLRCQVEGPYNPHEPDAPTFEEYECNGVITGPRRGRSAGRTGGVSSYVTSDTEGTNTIRVLLRADNLPESVEPAAGDLLIIEGVTWNVVENSPVKPANRHIMHKLVCKP